MRWILCTFVFLFAGPVFAAERPARLVNLSARTIITPGAGVLVAGFVVGGDSPKEILIRGLGPALVEAGVPDALARLKLDVFGADGRLLASTDHWDPELKGVFKTIGASPLPDQSHDAAVRLTLAPGNYSAQVSGLDGARGLALVEVFELGATSRLVNLSSRAQVGQGDGILIAGFVVAGEGPRRLLVRASGPALKPLGITDALADPLLTIFDQSGRVVGQSDDWGEGGLAPEIAALGAAIGASPFSAGSKDAAVVVELVPGVYSTHVRGAEAATGVGMLEIYDLSLLPAALPYAPAALRWTRAALDARLGPAFEQLNPLALDDRPWLEKRESRMAPGYYVRINPYELGDAPGPDNDYWSDSGQVGYVPDDPANDPGLDRIQTFAYYNRVFAISPRLDGSTARPHPDAQTREPHYLKLNGGPPMQPIAMVRNYGLQQNEQLMIYRDGLFAVAGMQTSRSGSERPYPGFKFPAHKVPRGLAVTTSNEFAVVTIWDTERQQGQLAVIALEAKFLPFHTWPYMGLPNQGSFSDFKLLGYVDLPMKSPGPVAAASNGLWLGPSSTGDKVLSQLKISDEATRKLVYDGAWQSTVAKGGYAIVASTEENLVALVDLTPLFAYMRESYLGSVTGLQATLAARGAGPDAFPQTFAVRPAIAPTVVWTGAVTSPTAVLAGHKIDRWSADRFKAYVAAQDGTLHIIDASPLMVRNRWEIRGKLEFIGTVPIGRNPVALAFTRHGESGLPLIPNDSTGTPRAPDPLNNMLYAACRGERSIDAVVTWHGQGQVYRRIKDARMSDPVAVSVAVRGNVITVADFGGRKLLSFRIGTLRDARNNLSYPPLGDGSLKHEFAGELPLPGTPFLVNSANLN